jgi:urease accessory protein
MILASSSPGIFGGDAFEQTIIVEPHAEVRLTSQSALQLHPSSCGSLAWIRSVYRVGEGGRLHCHWDPLIPFGGARLNQQIVIELARGARLHWSDSIMNGRRARGEQWRFASLAHELKVFRAGALQYLERYRIVPEEGRCDRHWVAGEASHFGTTLVSLADIAPGETERLHVELAGIAGVQAAADALNEGLLVVRLMATSGAAFREARALVDRWHARACGGGAGQV